MDITKKRLTVGSRWVYEDGRIFRIHSVSLLYKTVCLFNEQTNEMGNQMYPIPNMVGPMWTKLDSVKPKMFIKKHKIGDIYK